MTQASDLSCPSCGAPATGGAACPTCGATAAGGADERERKLRVLSETAAELRRERLTGAERAHALERRFEALAAALARAATRPPAT